jgi:hypothetical protein
MKEFHHGLSKLSRNSALEFNSSQGDQNVPKCRPIHFFVKTLCITFTVEKGSSKCWATSVIKKLPEVNNHPKGKNSPNLVTLVAAYALKAEAELTTTDVRNTYARTYAHMHMGKQ